MQAAEKILHVIIIHAYNDFAKEHRLQSTFWREKKGYVVHSQNSWHFKAPVLDQYWSLFIDD